MGFLLYLLIFKSEFVWPFFSANYVCACETAGLEKRSLNPFSDFPIKRKERKSKDIFADIQIKIQISQSNPWGIERALKMSHISSKQPGRSINRGSKHCIKYGASPRQFIELYTPSLEI